MRKCLFLGYGGGHINTLIPVIKELQKFDIEIEVIGINLAVEILRRNGIPCKSLASYMDDETLSIGLPLARKFHTFGSPVSYADSIAYYGFSMKDLIEEYGNELAQKIFNIYDRRLFLPVKTMKDILAKEKPNIVVVTTMYRFELATVIAAKEMGIMSIKVEDLLGRLLKPFPDKIHVDSDEDREKLINQGINPNKIVLKSELENSEIVAVLEKVYNLACTTQATKFSVLCDYTKNNLVKRGIDADSIEITGQPAFDSLIEYKDVNKHTVIKSFKLNPDKRVVTYMSQPLVCRENVLRGLVSAMKDHEDKQLIIKLHPNEDGIVHKNILKEFNYEALVIKDRPAPLLSYISDLVITISSTTGLEAVILDKPLLTINLTNEEDVIPFNEMGIGMGVYCKEDISTAIDKMFQDEKLQKELCNNRKKFENDGKAASRVANLIVDMVR
ncbi:MAG: UDP-N-acetylglucosamine 2-epimerase [Bacillota bacterium]